MWACGHGGGTGGVFAYRYLIAADRSLMWLSSVRMSRNKDHACFSVFSPAKPESPFRWRERRIRRQHAAPAAKAFSSIMAVKGMPADAFGRRTVRKYSEHAAGIDKW